MSHNIFCHGSGDEGLGPAIRFSLQEFQAGQLRGQGEGG